MDHFIAPAIAGLALAVATSASAQTTMLPFDGVGAVGLRTGYADRVDGPSTGGYTYGGSGTYTPNVLMSFGGIEDGSWVSARNWPTGYNDLVNVILAGVTGAAGLGAELRVTFVADPGHVASVHAFDIGNFGVALTLPFVRVVDESGAILFEELDVTLEASTSPNERNFVLAQPPAGRILTLRVGLDGLGALAANVGLDNVVYRQRAATTNEIGTAYCDPGVPNISGGPGHLRAWGQRSNAANDVTLVATGLPLGSFGLFLASRSSGLVMAPGNNVGNLCLGGAIGRYAGPGQIQNSQESGNIFLSLDLSAMPTPTGLVQAGAGETWYFQAWHRDSLSTGAAVSNFTEALELTFQLNLPDEDGEGFDHPTGSIPTELVTEDANVSGAPWGPDYLGLGLTGGSGRHGSIHVGAGETVMLDTDVQTFPIGPLVQIDVIGNGSGANYPPVSG